MSIDNTAGIGSSVMRGRNYPAIRQFTVFLENRVGQLLELVRRFEGTRVRIVALSITDSGECAFVRFLLSHPEAGREILERAGLAIIESDLIGVELPDTPQPLLEICTALLQAEVNIVQAYPLLVRPRGRAAVALMVDNIEMGQDTLAAKGVTMITEGAVSVTVNAIGMLPNCVSTIIWEAPIGTAVLNVTSAMIWSSEVRILANVIPGTAPARLAPAILRPIIVMGNEVPRTPEFGATLITLAVADTPVSRVMRSKFPTAS